MKAKVVGVALALAAIAIASGVEAQQRRVPASAPGVWKGVVISVNVQDRVIEAVGPQGGLRQFSVPVGADRLFSVKTGDTVAVKFVESVIVEFQKASDPPMTAPVDKVTVTPMGLPDIVDVHVKVVNAKVTAVDTVKRIISFTNAGYTYHYSLAPGAKGISMIKVGDDLILRATESTAIDIMK